MPRSETVARTTHRYKVSLTDAEGGNAGTIHGDRYDVLYEALQAAERDALWEMEITGAVAATVILQTRFGGTQRYESVAAHTWTLDELKRRNAPKPEPKDDPVYQDYERRRRENPTGLME